MFGRRYLRAAARIDQTFQAEERSPRIPATVTTASDRPWARLADAEISGASVAGWLGLAWMEPCHQKRRSSDRSQYVDESQLGPPLLCPQFRQRGRLRKQDSWFYRLAWPSMDDQGRGP